MYGFKTAVKEDTYWTCMRMVACGETKCVQVELANSWMLCWQKWAGSSACVCLRMLEGSFLKSHPCFCDSQINVAKTGK